MIKNQDINQVDIKICTRCIYDERVSGIRFDDKGVCNYCHQVDDLKSQYGTGSKLGEEKLKKIINLLFVHHIVPKFSFR